MRIVHVFATCIAVTTILSGCATTTTEGTGVHRGIPYTYTRTTTPGSFGPDEESYTVYFKGRSFYCGSDLFHCIPMLERHVKELQRRGPPENPDEAPRVREDASNPVQMLEDRQFGD
ncbi:hypothetical protein D6850_11975 [Roseovarius spongiae]|uniref:Uncharacterized protein n=1 Tax=Roseovarius spongiae TaxID=2320272 RepID=A0A3A8AUU5_9RHOB|nr:hypothetical protein [Roseovarius spongiae]RKF13903.1 hypothetical protein D6850_11975 [Roseovarius spongiae]